MILSESNFKGESADITVKVNAGFMTSANLSSKSSGTNSSSVFVQNVVFENIIEQPVDNAGTISTLIKYVNSNSAVSIYEHFNLTIDIEFPDSAFNGALIFEALSGSDPGIFSKLKICAVVPLFSGENLPCPKCMRKARSQATANSYTWTFDNFRSLAIRQFAGRAKRELNTLRF